MKTKIVITMIVAFMIGAFASTLYAQTVQLIEVPATINGYRTFDLLVYLSQLKAKDDADKARALISIPNSLDTYIQNTPSTGRIKARPMNINVE